MMAHQPSLRWLSLAVAVDRDGILEKGELRPEVVVDCELREGEAMIV